MVSDERHVVRPLSVGECVMAADADGTLDDAESAVEDEAGDSIQFVARSVKKMQDPQKPSNTEVDEHMKTHLPYRSQCRHCVRGMGRQVPHQCGTQEPGLCEVHFDNGFLGKENEPGKTIPTMVVKERKSRMLMAAVTPTKNKGDYISKRIMGFLKEIEVQYGDLVVKSDQEEAAKAVVEGVGKLKVLDGGGKYIMENSPVGASQSNGVIERGIQSVAGQTRVLLDGLQDRWKVEIPIEHPMVSYIVEYAAVLLNKFEVGADGKTSYERCKGKRANTLGIKIGEAVMWRRKRIGGPLGKLTWLWEDGIYLVRQKGDRGRCDLFAAMPPLESKKMSFRMAAGSRKIWKNCRLQRRKLMLIGVKKAHLNGMVPEEVLVYVKLPDGRVWRLRRW